MNRVLFRRGAAGLLAGMLCALSVPAIPALADGAASTRNIILGGAAAALLIINHNRKVHEKYAEYDRRQAATQQAADNAWAAYQSEQSAYNHEVAINQSLQHEVAVQHSMIVAQQRQMAKQHHTIVSMRSQRTVASRPVTRDVARRPTSVAQNSEPSGAGPFMQQTTLTTSARAQASRRAHQTNTRVVAEAFGWGIF
ncbi:MAG: hypothetical protein JOZ97_05035 [Candidatus Eremiobacteraeota bacterium]|nr:hypothetical protein [Candidatus Eremiobacteraeota bacterium]